MIGDRDVKLFEYPLRWIDQPPTDHAVDRRDRTAFDRQGDRLSLRVVELGRPSRRLTIQQTVVPDDLKSNATDLRCLGAGRSIVDRSKCQQPPGLRSILGLIR